MSLTCIGIDEAGYGPTLGPLVIGVVAVDGTDAAAIDTALAAMGVCDSKRLHRPKDLAPLERVALAGINWLTGGPVRDAAALFALLTDDQAALQASPWLAGAAELRLPLAAAGLHPWTVSGIRPHSLRGRIVHPLTLNRAAAQGCNKASLEVDTIAALLAGIADATDADLRVVVDRLGGRRYYGNHLDSALASWQRVDQSEAAAVSRYDYRQSPSGRTAEIAFMVGGEGHSRLTALASCIAKYVREIHMHLFNTWWCNRCPGLAPTAGYPQDAARWLADLPPEERQRHGPHLIRDPLTRSEASSA